MALPHGAIPDASEHRSNVPDHSHRWRPDGLSNHGVPPTQVTGDPRTTRSTAGGPLDLVHVTACRHPVHGRAHRLHGPSVVDGVVLRAVAGMAAVDGSRAGSHGWRIADLDPPQPGEEPDGYGSHPESAYSGDDRPLSLGPAPVLRRLRIGGPGQLPGGRELVPFLERRAVVRPDRRPNPNRRGEAVGALWRLLPGVQGTHRPLLPDRLQGSQGMRLEP